jgi:hypothetical protein
MELLQLRRNNQGEFAEAAEFVMECHLARLERDEFYLVVGSRVGILLNEAMLAEPEPEFFDQPWLPRSLPERTAVFQRWLDGLDEAQRLTRKQLPQPPGLRFGQRSAL